MIACAEWLGRDHKTCTRKPDGCVCEPQKSNEQLSEDSVSKMAETIKRDGHTIRDSEGPAKWCTRVAEVIRSMPAKSRETR